MAEMLSAVRRAVEIVAMQLGCDATDALDALKGVAGAAEERLEHVALVVLDGSVRFDA
jgi:hypothetical protein